MDQTRTKTKKRADAARGAKALITAGAIAATLGGWAVLSVGDAQANAQPGAVAAAPPTSQQQPASPRRGRFQPRTGTTQPNFGGFTPDQGTAPSVGGSTAPSLGGFGGSTTFPRVRTRSSR